MDVSNDEVKQLLKKDLEDGIYNLGELIVPQTFTKVSVINNKVVWEEININGRRIPLADIRQSMLEEHKPFMRLRTDEEFESLGRDEIIRDLMKIHEFHINDNELDTLTLLERLMKFERTRNLMTWHDCSTVSNHSHFLMMVSAMYDPAVYFTDDEFYEKNKEKVQVQANVERPHLYIFAILRGTY